MAIITRTIVVERRLKSNITDGYCLDIYEHVIFELGTFGDHCVLHVYTIVYGLDLSVKSQIQD